MKKIDAIVRTSKLEPLKEALFQAGVKGMTVSEVQGCGNQHGWKEYFRGSEVMVNTLPKIKFEIVAEGDAVETLVEVIASAGRTGAVGDGKIFVMPVEEVVRIRTSQRGSEAV